MDWPVPESVHRQGQRGRGALGEVRVAGIRRGDLVRPLAQEDDPMAVSHDGRPGDECQHGLAG